MPRPTNKPGLRKTSVRLDPVLQNTGGSEGELVISRGSSHTYTIREYILSFFFSIVLSTTPHKMSQTARLLFWECWIMQFTLSFFWNKYCCECLSSCVVMKRQTALEHQLHDLIAGYLRKGTAPDTCVPYVCKLPTMITVLLQRLDGMIHGKPLVQCLAHSRYSERAAISVSTLGREQILIPGFRENFNSWLPAAGSYKFFLI